MAVRPLLIIAGILLIGCSRGQNAKSSLPHAIRLLENNRPAEAVSVCEAILSSEPNDYQAVLLRGEAYEALGNRAGARAAYERALQLRPVDSEPRRHLRRLDDDLPRRLTPGVENSESKECVAIAPEPHAVTPLKFMDDKAYRRPASQEVPANDTAVYGATPTNSIVKKLRSAIAVGQKKDREAKLPPLIAYQLQQDGLEEQPATELRPVSITRFDLGLGFNVNPTAFVPPAATTGQRRALVSDVDRHRLFVGHAVDDRLYVGQAMRCSPQPHVDNCRPSRLSLVGQLRFSQF